MQEFDKYKYFIQTNMKYNYVQLLHEGEDYILVRYGKEEVEITGPEADIVKALLKKIEKQ